MSQAVPFRNIQGARRTARALQAALTSAGIEIPLASCHEQMARRLGRRSWHDLITAVASGREQGDDDVGHDALAARLAAGMIAERRRNPIAFMTAWQIVEYVDDFHPRGVEGVSVWMDMAMESLHPLIEAMVWLRDNRGIDLTPDSLVGHFTLDAMTRMALPASSGRYRDMPVSLRRGLGARLVQIPGFPDDLKAALASSANDRQPARLDPEAALTFSAETIRHHDDYLGMFVRPIARPGPHRLMLLEWLKIAGRSDVMAYLRHCADLGQPPATARLSWSKLRTRLGPVIGALVWLRDHRAVPLTAATIRRHADLEGLARLAAPKNLAAPRYQPLPNSLRDDVRLVLDAANSSVAADRRGQDDGDAWPGADVVGSGRNLEPLYTEAIDMTLQRMGERTAVDWINALERSETRARLGGSADVDDVPHETRTVLAGMDANDDTYPSR